MNLEGYPDNMYITLTKQLSTAAHSAGSIGIYLPLEAVLFQSFLQKSILCLIPLENSESAHANTEAGRNFTFLLLCPAS